MQEDDVAGVPDELNHAGELDAIRPAGSAGTAGGAPKVSLLPYSPIGLYDQ